MSDIGQLQQQAFRLHRDGRLADAERIYRQILADLPDHASTLHALGTLELQSGHGTAALAHLQQAVAGDPARAEYHHHLGEACRGSGRLAEAQDCFQQAVTLDANLVAAHYSLGLVALERQDRDRALTAFRQVVRLKPELAEAHAILGDVLQTVGRLDEAIDCFRSATRLRPDLMAAHYNLGNACRQAGRNEDAAASYREAIRLEPGFAQAHNNLGTVLRNLGDDAAAAAAFAEAVRLVPESAEALHNLGTLKKQAGRLLEARALLSRAIQLDPAHAPSHFNLGSALYALQEWDLARRCHQEALRLRPNYAEPNCGMGMLCMARGEYDEALGYFDAALAIQPELAEAHFNRGMLLLVKGDLAAGWPEYNWRWRASGARPRPPGPEWDGAPLEGRTILLFTEQGYGDTLQFIRYAPLVRARGGRVVVACPGHLIPILSTCPGIDGFYRVGEEPLPTFDVSTPLLDLPGILETELESVPREVPYLSAQPDRVERWRERLGGKDAFRVGIHWQGNPAFGWDQYRSMPLTEFAPLGTIEGVRLISLQHGSGTEQLAGAPFAVEDVGAQLDAGDTFCSKAAVIRALDLVVTSDTAVAHLAGALGARVWVALSFGPDWRWLLGREDCPWYPTMRLFRQPELGRWAPVFERIAAELQQLAGAAVSGDRGPQQNP